MIISLLVQALGAMGLFASRAFVPAFAAALILRFGPNLGLSDFGMLSALGVAKDAAPTWFTSDLSLIVLGILAGLEIAATKNPDARAILNQLDQYAKPLMAALTVMGVASAGDAAFATSLLSAAESVGATGGMGLALAPVLAIGLTWSSIPAAISAAGTFVIASTRNFVMGLFIDADEDDDIGLQKLISWGEDLWAMFGLFFFILFPFIMLALIGLATGFVFLVKWWVHRKEEKSRVPCESCGELMYRCAMKCGQCKTPNPSICDVGFLGQSDTNDPADIPTQPYQLAEAKRCPTCATKLEERRPRQACEVCRDDPFADPAFAQAYVDRISARLPVILLLCAGLGLIWIVGVIPAVILYRMTVVAPFRRYIPRGRNFAMKWGLRLVFFILLALQIFPAVGAVTVPIMALLSFLAYRQMFVCMADNDEDCVIESKLITEPAVG